MATAKRPTMGESYKDALEQRKLDIFRRQANEISKKDKEKHRVVRVKREDALEIHQKKIEKKQAEVAFHEKNLMEIKKAAKNDFFNILATFMLMFFVVFLVASIVLFLRGFDRATEIGALILALLFLCLSIIAQVKSIEAEQQIKNYTIRLQRATRELQSLQNFHLPPQ